MNDLSVSPSAPTSKTASVWDQRVEHMGGIGQSCALFAEQLRMTPSFREVALTLLSRRLEGTATSPAAEPMFINNRTRDGAISSVPLIEGLLHALIHGVAAFQHSTVGLYTRYDSTEDEHRVSGLAIEDALATLEELAVELPAAYRDHLKKIWEQERETTQIDADHEVLIVSRHIGLSALQRTIFSHEVELKYLEGFLSPDEKARLRQVAEGASKSGIYTLSLTAADGATGILSSVFVVTQSDALVNPLTAKTSQGSVFLYTPAKGLEKFESLAVLDIELSKRLADHEAREFLLENLLLRDRARFSQVGGHVHHHYAFLNEQPFNYQILALRHKQREDFDFVLDQAQRKKEDISVFLQQVSNIQHLTDFDDALEHRFTGFASLMQQRMRPRWLKYAPEWQQESYLEFDALYQRREQAVARALGGLESLEIYARNKIGDYTRQHLGYSVDPEQVFITLPDEINLSSGALKYDCRKSLLAFAMDGLPTFHRWYRAIVDIPKGTMSAGLTVEFIEKLIADLDVRHHYRQEVQARYRQPQTVRAMVHLQDSILQLSAWAAKLQGHLSDRGLELINMVRGDKTQEGRQLSVGGITLSGANNRLKDLIIFRQTWDKDEHYVLYAPGAPGGRDLFEFDSWYKLSVEVGGWLKDSAGVQYLLDQVPIKSRDDVTAFILSIQTMPTHWRELSVRYMPCAGLNFEQALTQLISLKVERRLDEQTIVIAGEHRRASYEDRRALALLSARITELNNAFAAITNLVSYRDYVHAGSKKILNDFLRENGSHETVDPDTIFFDLSKRTRDDTPDFSRYTTLRTLTSLFMEGYSSNYKFNEHVVMYSSIGQDLSQLPLSFIDQKLRTDFGERYIEFVKAELKSPRHGNYAKRRALFAKCKQFELYRDALGEHLQGRLTRAQYLWLMHLIVGLDSSASATSGPDRVHTPGGSGSSSVNVLHLKDRLIEGTIIFRNFDTEDPDYNLVYTPGAPDGLLFRRTKDIGSTMQHPGMRQYYYGRAHYKDQRIIGTLVETLAKDPESVEGVNVARIVPEHRITNLEQLYDVMIQRMIQDVDDQTESLGERLLSTAYTVVKWVGTILLLPFPAAALAWGALHTAIDFVRGYWAYRDGDRATAFGFFAWGTTGLWLGASSAKTVAEGGKSLVWGGVLWASRQLSRMAHMDFAEQETIAANEAPQ